MNCNGDCAECQKSTVFNELTPEARQKLIEQFSFLKGRYLRIQKVIRLRSRRSAWDDDWHYPYE